MNWQDVPLRAINFSSFWLANFAEGSHTIAQLVELSNKNKYNINQEKLLNIIDELVAGGLVEFKPDKGNMVFFLMKDETEAVIADFKKNNLTL